jgi:hypothetical protein
MIPEGIVYSLISVCSEIAKYHESGGMRLMQISINGALLEDISQAAKYTNMEVKLGTDQGWYKNEGSFCGFGLLNPELNTGPASVATATTLRAYSSAWGDILGNLPAANARQTFAVNLAAAPWNVYGGQQNILPLGLISGVGRMDQYIPLSVMGELNLTLFTGQPGEVLFQTAGTDGDYSLAGTFLEYDIIVPHPMYAELLHKMGNDPNEQGINLPFESTITASSTSIPASPGTLSQVSVVVSRATQNLLRTMAVFQPTSFLANRAFPIQSCFGHAGVGQFQVRVGSQYMPAQPAIGDAGMWAATMTAFGSAARNNSTTVVNRNNWGTFTINTTGDLNPYEPILAGTAATAALVANNHLAFTDSFVPAMGFRVVSGKAMPLDVDGISLSGSSGAQLIWELAMAPAVAVTPTIALVALRFLSAHGGSVRIIGA